MNRNSVNISAQCLVSCYISMVNSGIGGLVAGEACVARYSGELC